MIGGDAYLWIGIRTVFSRLAAGLGVSPVPSPSKSHVFHDQFLRVLQGWRDALAQVTVAVSSFRLVDLDCTGCNLCWHTTDETNIVTNIQEINRSSLANVQEGDEPAAEFGDLGEKMRRSCGYQCPHHGYARTMEAVKGVKRPSLTFLDRAISYAREH
jgi:hypothetical protein